MNFGFSIAGKSFTLAVAMLVWPIYGAAVAQEAGPFAAYDLRLVLGSESGMTGIERAFASVEEVRNTIEVHEPGVCDDKSDLRACIDAYEQAALQKGGVYAAFAVQAAHVARSTLSPGGEFVGITSAPTISGQINEYCLASPTQPGFYFLEAAQSNVGAFSVICVTVMTKTASVGANDGDTLYQNYQIKIGDCAWDQRSNDPSNIFPAAAAATKLVIPATQANEDFDFKLYAKGDQIEVLTYWTSTYGTNWAKYNASSTQPPGIHNIFKIDPDACVDMMFVKKPPVVDGAFRLPTDWRGGLNYCLGRCAQPPIINTQ